MATLSRTWVLAAIWLAVAASLWVVAVPAWLSLATLGWLNAAMMGLVIVFVATMRSAAPTRSIAHILYDTENQTGRSR